MKQFNFWGLIFRVFKLYFCTVVFCYCHNNNIKIIRIFGGRGVLKYSSSSFYIEVKMSRFIVKTCNVQYVVRKNKECSTSHNLKSNYNFLVPRKNARLLELYVSHKSHFHLQQPFKVEHV